jgi:hypothetical protein
MKWLLVLLVPGGSLLLLGIALRKRWLKEHYVSEAWLQAYDASERERFDGVSIQWPIKKVINEHAGFNTVRLRKRA